MPDNNPVLQPNCALSIAEELFRSMLPQCEPEFYRELEAWHPELLGIARLEYLRNKSYPRCWIVTASIIFATSYPEYAQHLLTSLRALPEIIVEADAEIAHDCGPKLLGSLNDTSWRWAICRAGSDLYRSGPRTLTRAFGVGLNFAFIQPEVARAVVQILRTTEQRNFDWQVAAAGFVVRRNPIRTKS